MTAALLRGFFEALLRQKKLKRQRKWSRRHMSNLSTNHKRYKNDRTDSLSTVTNY